MKTDKEIKTEVLNKIKPILKKKGLKGTLAFPDGRRMCLTLKVNEETAKWFWEGRQTTYFDDSKWEESFLYCYKEDTIPCLVNETRYGTKNKEAGTYIMEIGDALNLGNWDNSDVQSDYFDFGWLSEIRIIIKED
jgi:hypothetical protein